MSRTILRLVERHKDLKAQVGGMVLSGSTCHNDLIGYGLLASVGSHEGARVSRNRWWSQWNRLAELVAAFSVYNSRSSHVALYRSKHGHLMGLCIRLNR